MTTPRRRPMEGHVGVAVAADALLSLMALAKAWPEGDADVLDGVVIVDMQVALALDAQHQAVAATVHHVVKEGNPGIELALPVPSRSMEHLICEGARKRRETR